MWALFRGGRLDAAGPGWFAGAVSLVLRESVLLGVAVWKSCRSLLEAVDIVSVTRVFGASRWFYAAGATNFWRLLSAEPWLLNQFCVWGERTKVLKRTLKLTSKAGLNFFSVGRHPGPVKSKFFFKMLTMWKDGKKMKMRHKFGKA